MSSERHPRFRTYAEFWPFYLREHAQPGTRTLHLLGTGTAVVLLLLAAILRAPWLLLAALFAGYGPSWVAHFFVEKNRPATFTHPLWSLISDFRMVGTWLSGGLERELEKAGIPRAIKDK
jgi:hypothetical protein